MFFTTGDRVAINLNIDTYKIGDEIKFGEVIALKQGPRSRGTISYPTLITVKADDGTIYRAFLTSQRPMHPNTFIKKADFLKQIKERQDEINRELTVIGEYENIFLDEITSRIIEGRDTTYLKKKYAAFIVPTLSLLAKDSQRIVYLLDNMLDKFKAPKEEDATKSKADDINWDLSIFSDFPNITREETEDDEDDEDDEDGDGDEDDEGDENDSLASKDEDREEEGKESNDDPGKNDDGESWLFTAALNSFKNIEIINQAQ